MLLTPSVYWKLTNLHYRIRVGDNFSDQSDQGPHNSKLQYDKIMSYIEEGKKEGATLHMGGGGGDGTKGYYINVSFHVSTSTHPPELTYASRRSSQTCSQI